MSRPRKAHAAAKSRRIHFRLTQEAYALLEAEAHTAGLSVHQLARIRSCSKTRKVIVKSTTRLDPAYIAELKRIGHNLNQLVKNAHIFKRVSPQVEPLCELIEQLILKAIDQENLD